MIRSIKNGFLRIAALALLLCLFATGNTYASTVSFRAAAQASVAATPIAGITYLGAPGAVDSASNGSLTPGYPAGWQAGDFLICIVESRDNVAATMAGWTQLSAANSGAAHRASIFYKFAATGDDTTPPVTHSGGNAIIARIIGFRGVDPVTPLDGNSFTVSAADFTTEATAINTTTANTMLVFTAHMADNHTTLGTPAPGTWAQAFFNNTGSGNDASISAYYGMRAGTGTQPAVAATRTGAANAISHGAQIALREEVLVNGITVAVPTGTIENDLMVASIAVTADTSGALNGINITAPAGWDLVRLVTQSAGTGADANRHSKLATYRRAATASEPADYTWVFSAAHTGAVGGIASFSGVDLTAPVDTENGTATVSGTSHSAPTLTTTEDRGMLVTIHEFASSRAWTSPAGMTSAANVFSSTANTTAGISMQMNYEARPTAGVTGARAATVGGNADRGATQSVSLKPRPLICFNDSLNGSDNSVPGNWITSNTQGSFGNPRIVTNRLRLTDGSVNAATLATLQRLFPGSGNRIEIEFDHFAYGGTGADGIAVVLSDSAITPVPGAYGGSLGYAQKTGINGFAGGWLGVGLDEFGNYSDDGEGRPTGPGVRADAVAIRGSGSGSGNAANNYRYHTGTAASLSPQVDNNGAASPPHRYRIIIDHSNTTNAYVSVERKTAAAYVPLIAAYDAKTQTGQAAVPANWIISFTGSTGSQYNIHEIDNLQICATEQSAISNLDHFEISVTAAASTCTPQIVTIRAKDSSNNTLVNYAGSIDISTSSSHGDWAKVVGQADGALVNGTADDGAATYGFLATDGGEIQLTLANTHADDLTINVRETTTALGNTTSGTTVNFRNSAFVITENDSLQLAGKDKLMTVKLVTNTDGVCAVDDKYTGAKALDVWMTRVAPDPAGTSPTVNGVTPPNAAPAVNQSVHNLTGGLTFTAGEATFTLATTDVGKYSISLRDDTRSFANAVDLTGSSAFMTIRPWLDVRVTGNPKGAAPTDTIFTTAGSVLTGTVRGVLWRSDDDNDQDGIPNTNADLSDNPVATHFAWLTALSPTTPITPTGGVTGALGGTVSLPQNSYVNGVRALTDLTYAEVGSFTLSATAANYLNSGVNLTGTASPVGRFIPAHFRVSGGTLGNRAAAGCTPASTFSYMNEDISLGFTVTAQNVSNNTTQNYVGTFAKRDPAVAASYNFGARDTGGSGTNLSTRLAIPTPLSPEPTWSAGAVSVSIANASINRASPDAPDGPYSATSIGIAMTDTDGVTTTGFNMDVNGDSTNDRVRLGTTDIRYGRLRLSNTLGSSIQPLPVPMRLEYWNGKGFVTNTADSCTTLNKENISLGGYQKIEACNVAFDADNNPLTKDFLFVNGVASPVPRLLPPGGPIGSVDLRVNLGAAGGEYCSAQGAGPGLGTSSAARSYLLGRWDDGANPDAAATTDYDDDPRARAAFGLDDKTPRRIIYFRENY